MPAIAKWYEMEVEFPLGYPDQKIQSPDEPQCIYY